MPYSLPVIPSRFSTAESLTQTFSRTSRSSKVSAAPIQTIRISQRCCTDNLMPRSMCGRMSLISFHPLRNSLRVVCSTICSYRPSALTITSCSQSRTSSPRMRNFSLGTNRGREYNRNKAESERRLQPIIGERLTIVRPTGIKGHGDDTPDLLTWLLRMQAGDEHIAPGNGHDPFQMVDVKDVASFIALAITKSFYGAFNLTGRLLTFREYLEACKAATYSGATLTWIPQQFLHEHGLESDDVLHTFAGYFPSWLPEARYQGLYRISSEKAFRAGWKTR